MILLTIFARDVLEIVVFLTHLVIICLLQPTTLKTHLFGSGAHWGFALGGSRRLCEVKVKGELRGKNDFILVGWPTLID